MTHAGIIVSVILGALALWFLILLIVKIARKEKVDGLNGPDMQGP
jgi:hypothetical protein